MHRITLERELRRRCQENTRRLSCRWQTARRQMNTKL